MTFDDDFCQFNFPDGERKTMKLKDNKLEWPPPERIAIGSIMFKRIAFSGLTDEQREKCPAVVRGSVYEPVDMKTIGTKQ